MVRALMLVECLVFMQAMILPCFAQGQPEQSSSVRPDRTNYSDRGKVGVVRRGAGKPEWLDVLLKTQFDKSERLAKFADQRER